MTNSNRFIFIVDTNQYSGNFEREMCAHLTNQVGGCGVGEDYVFDEDEIVKDVAEDTPEIKNVKEILIWIEENIRQESDDNGCLRPCAIWPTPGRTNNGYGVHTVITEDSPTKYPAYESVAIFFNAHPPMDVLDYMVARSKTFTFHCRGRQENPKVIGFRLIKEETMVSVAELVKINFVVA